MAENDIYNSQGAYERYISNFEKFLEEPNPNQHCKGKRVYYIKNKDNLKYFNQILSYFNSKDLSFKRRIKILDTLLQCCHATAKDLQLCKNRDLDEIIAFLQGRNASIESKKEFIKNIKVIWKYLFPVIDVDGNFDPNVYPPAIRHLKNFKIEKSKQRDRNERHTIEELEKILKALDNKPMIQAFVSTIHESFTRPQELAYLKIRDIQFFDNYGFARISSHGKQGTKTIVFETLSYPYIVKAYNSHPNKNNSDSFFFYRKKDGEYFPLKLENVNKHIRLSCQKLGIKKNITCYSLKRGGITQEYLSGTPVKIISSKAGWTSANQIKVYDLATREEALKLSRLIFLFLFIKIAKIKLILYFELI